jgi:hypothetical protein
LIQNVRTLPVIENWNRALELISDESRYCRILHADDVMYPDCLEESVALADRYPTVGIVGSLRLRGDVIQCEGLARNRDLFSGAEIARLFLREQVFALAPTTSLVRADLVRARRPFYPPHYLHADLAAYFELLSKCDFAFVHKVLSFSRVHENSISTTIADRDRTILKEWLLMLQAYGPDYFEPDELLQLERSFLQKYYRTLIRGLVVNRRKSFFEYHLAGLREANRLPSASDLLRAAGAEMAGSFKHPGRLARHLTHALRPPP